MDGFGECCNAGLRIPNFELWDAVSDVRNIMFCVFDVGLRAFVFVRLRSCRVAALVSGRRAVNFVFGSSEVGCYTLDFRMSMLGSRVSNCHFAGFEIVDVGLWDVRFGCSSFEIMCFAYFG